MAALPVRLVTDSTADIPAALAEGLDIAVVPLNIHFGPEVHLDGVTLTKEEFYHKLARASILPTTSQPSVGDFETAYRKLAPGPVVSIHIAADLSGTLNSARLAAEAVAGEVDVRVIDSRTVTMALGWLVVLAARAAAAGATVDEVVAIVETRISSTRLLAQLDTLEFLRRGGRIGPAAALVGAILHVKPIIEVREGKVLPVEKVRTRARALQRLVELVQAQGPYEELAVGHSADREGAEQLRLALAAAGVHPIERMPIFMIGGVVGTHAGPGVVGATAIARR